MGALTAEPVQSQLSSGSTRLSLYSRDLVMGPLAAVQAQLAAEGLSDVMRALRAHPQEPEVQAKGLVVLGILAQVPPPSRIDPSFPLSPLPFPFSPFFGPQWVEGMGTSPDCHILSSSHKFPPFSFLAGSFGE